MPSPSARDLLYGRRGGRWLPDYVDGQLPFGVVDGVRRTCPTPVYVRCDCGYWWVAPSTAAKPCDRCGQTYVRLVIEPDGSRRRAS